MGHIGKRKYYYIHKIGSEIIAFIYLSVHYMHGRERGHPEGLSTMPRCGGIWALTDL